MSIRKKIMSDFEVAVSVDKVAVSVDITVLKRISNQSRFAFGKRGYADFFLKMSWGYAYLFSP